MYHLNNIYSSLLCRRIRPT